MQEVLITCLPVEHSLSMARGSQLWAVVLPQVTQVVFFLTLGTFQGNPKGGKRGCSSHTSLGAVKEQPWAFCQLLSSTCELTYTDFVGVGFGMG